MSERCLRCACGAVSAPCAVAACVLAFPEGGLLGDAPARRAEQVASVVLHLPQSPSLPAPPARLQECQGLPCPHATVLGPGGPNPGMWGCDLRGTLNTGP